MHVLFVYINESSTISFSGKICHADRRYLFFLTIFISYIFSIRFLIECRSFVIWVPSGASSLSSRRRHSSGLNDDVSNVKRFCNRHHSCLPPSHVRIFVLRPRLHNACAHKTTQPHIIILLYRAMMIIVLNLDV